MKKLLIFVAILMFSLSAIAISNQNIYEKIQSEYGTDNMVRINPNQFVYFYEGEITKTREVTKNNTVTEYNLVNYPYNETTEYNITSEIEVNGSLVNVTELKINTTYYNNWVNESSTQTNYWNETENYTVYGYQAIMVDYDEINYWAFKITIISEVII